MTGVAGVPPEALEAAAAELGARARRDHPLGPLTTYRVGGPAAFFVEAGGDDDLRAVGRAARRSGLPVLVVGRGSNLLVSDEGFAGIALSLGPAYSSIEVEGTEVVAGGAVALPVLARRTAALGLTGLEWAVGVPGSVGGGVRMNAGGHGSDVSRVLVSARLHDLGTGDEAEVPAARLALGYRRSSVGPGQVVVSARFGLQPGDPEAAEAAVAAVVRWRLANQPGGPNAGSVFTNPPGDSAGRLIDAAGLKGLRHGSAFVSPKHANFIQVDPGGSAGDVFALMEKVRAEVLQQAGTLLQPEVHLVGFGSNSLSTGD